MVVGHNLLSGWVGGWVGGWMEGQTLCIIEILTLGDESLCKERDHTPVVVGRNLLSGWVGGWVGE